MENALDVTGKAMAERLYVCAICQAGLTEAQHFVRDSLKPRVQQAGL